MIKKISVLFLFILIISNCTFAIDTLTAEQQAIKDVAHAFSMRGTLIDYDSRQMTYQTGDLQKTRSHGYASSPSNGEDLEDWGWFYSPEDATTQDKRFSVCSHFVNLIYHEAFSKNGKAYQLKSGLGKNLFVSSHMMNAGNPNSPSYNEQLAVYYVQSEEPGDIYERSYEIREKIKSIIEPGDILVYSNSDGAHAVVYVGDGYTYGSGGSNSNPLYPVAAEGIKYNLKAKADFVNNSIKRNTKVKW